MSDGLQKKIFSRNLNELMFLSEKTQSEVASAIGVSPQTFNTWMQGIAIPRMEKIQLLADYFHVKKSLLIEQGNYTSRTEEKDFNKVLSDNLRYYLDIRNITQVELAHRLGVGTTSVYNWTSGLKTPRMDKVDMMCNIFRIRREDLLTDTSKEQTYYTNPETAKVAQEIFDNSDLRILFDAAKDSTPEQLKLAAEMLRQFKKTAGEE
jgi:hypothetical protein